ncbi:hypothetical protein CHLRE_07g344500v5 [Chlamydomonas reinhardtii]|uniref:Glycosyl transferase CAP10 domain-containing protein n=1 Tax=Chlamydomonas reinhardtii TaxID=3055 RepID=A0A2K3DKU1_CHLRE|nr:uncharacterized protein CHLRE_07g344500v5 [Chlamydomonas reinhardtii]PNW81152.1 hypothetical protein CHLRE_07g344500v5 [Chlamydomonas reinhardtii]
MVLVMMFLFLFSTKVVTAIDPKTVKPFFDLLEVPVGHLEPAEHEWAQHLRENLEADIAYWRQRAPLKANAAMQLYDDLMRLHNLKAVHQLVLIYKNQIYYPFAQDPHRRYPPDSSAPQIHAFYNHLQPLLDRGDLKLPDVLFVHNVEDNQPRWCGPGRNCSAPLLSLIKTVDAATGNDTDILIPQFLYVARSSYQYPWHLKKDVAFFRGTPFCSNWWLGKFKPECETPCTRAWLAYLSMRDEDQGRGQSVLDVALTAPYKGVSTCVNKAPPVMKTVPLANHTYYKYLIHLEGHTASFRLDMLLHTNSLVLLQNQPFLAHYSRSLKPDVHFVPFWNTTSRGREDIYDVVQAVRHKDSVYPEEIQHMIREGQSFAVRFLTLAARVRYLRDALLAYKSLFSDMDPFIEELVVRMRERGFQIPRDIAGSSDRRKRRK